MAHNLYGERFYSYRQPAWHGLGKVMEIKMGAVQAFEAIGAYDISTRPVTTTVNNQPELCPAQAVIRQEKGQEKCLGVVGPEYQVIGPRKIAEIWDQAVGMPVETFGCLGKGEAMFITTGLPSYEVKGDEIQNYLMAVARFGAGGAGIGANETVITGVRVVCQNTLVAGMKAAVERYKIVHDENAVDRMWKWLHDAWEKAESRSRMLAEAYNVLANYKITDADQVQVLESAYPLPHKPGTDAPEQVVAGRNKLWEQGCELRLEQRQAVAELFAGAGMGMNTEAAAGTAWGLYNAAVELSDYGGRKLKRMGAAAESSLFGDRAMVKVRAFEACSRVAGVK